jgi:hypothetical protein
MVIQLIARSDVLEFRLKSQYETCTHIDDKFQRGKAHNESSYA